MRYLLSKRKALLIDSSARFLERFSGNSSVFKFPNNFKILLMVSFERVNSRFSPLNKELFSNSSSNSFTDSLKSFRSSIICSKLWQLSVYIFSFGSSPREIILLFNNEEIELDFSNDSDRVSSLMIWISSSSGKSISLLSKFISLKTSKGLKTSLISK